MLSEIIVKKLGIKLVEKLKEKINENGEEQIRQVIFDKIQLYFLETYRKCLNENILKSYGNESFYEDLCKVLLTNNNLDVMLNQCYDRNIIDDETFDEFIERITKDIKNEKYNCILVKNVIKHIAEASFASFNKLADGELNKLKNIIMREEDKTRASIRQVNDNSIMILEKQEEILEKINSNEIMGNLISTEITQGCKNSVKHFVGRKNDIIEIKRILEEDSANDEKTSLWIFAMGGMGKTQLCRKLYSSLKSKYLYIGWVSYNGNFKESLVNSLSLLDRVEDLDVQYKKAINYLNSLGKKLLLFIDNYDTQNDCINDIEALQCHVIITSRCKNLDTFDGYKLGFMTLNECKTLFRKFYTLENNIIMNEIIHKTGYLTLAVELVAKTGQKMELPLQEYYCKLKEKGFDIHTVIQSNWDNSGEKLTAALSKHFSIVFDLTHFNSNIEVMYILKNFSILPYLGVTQRDIVKWLDLDREENMLCNLVDYGWLQKTYDYEYMMHPIISYTVKKMEHPVVQECINLVNSLSQCIAVQTGENYVQAFTYLPYAASVGEYFVQNKGASEDILGFLYIRLAEIHRQNGEYNKAIKWGEEAYNLYSCIEDSGKKGRLGNLVYNILSEICLDMRNCNEECRKWALYAIKSDKQHKNEIDDVQRSTSFHNLACAYIQLEDNKKALKYENKAVSLRESNLPETDIRVINTYRNLAMIYRRLGMIEQAYKYQKRVLNALEDIHKDDKNHPDFPVAYNLYSFILWDMNKINDAITFQKKAIEIREKINKNDPKLAINYNNLGMLSLNGNYIEEALFWQKKAIDMDLKNRDKNHLDLATDYFNYAKILRVVGRNSEAIDYLLKSRAIEVNNKKLNNLQEIDNIISEIEEKNTCTD